MSEARSTMQMMERFVAEAREREAVRIDVEAKRRWWQSKPTVKLTDSWVNRGWLVGVFDMTLIFMHDAIEKHPDLASHWVVNHDSRNFMDF